MPQIILVTFLLEDVLLADCSQCVPQIETAHFIDWENKQDKKFVVLSGIVAVSLSLHLKQDQLLHTLLLGAQTCWCTGEEMMTWTHMVPSLA